MTQQDYDNDLVFRSDGKEYARIDGNGEWKPRTPATKLEIRAKPEVWAAVEKFGRNDMDVSNCILELRSRVETLEAAANGPDHIGEVNKMVPDGSLVERVAYAITGDSDGPLNWENEARAAIREIAAWVDRLGYHSCAAELKNQSLF
jgi:hypothetical protein